MSELPYEHAWALTILGALALAAVICALSTARGKKLMSRNEPVSFSTVAIIGLLAIQAIVWGGANLAGIGAAVA